MLHIILLILKIIGFLLLAIIGIVIFALLLILCAPAGYQFHLSTDDSKRGIRGNLRFYWIRPLFSGEICYDKGNLTWKIRAAWKKFGDGEEPKTSKTQASALNEKVNGQKSAGQKKEEQKSLEEQTLVQKKAVSKNSVQKKTDQKEIFESESLKEEHWESEHSNNSQKIEENKQSSKRKIWSLETFLKKIKYTFRKIYANIKALIMKKETIERFLKNEIHKNAFAKFIKEMKRFLFKLRPQKVEIKSKFGFEDPAVTGYVLAFISCICPFFGEYADIEPDFENKVLDLEMQVEGKIRILSLFLFVFHMFVDKNVRITIAHFKKLKL